MSQDQSVTDALDSVIIASVARQDGVETAPFLPTTVDGLTFPPDLPNSAPPASKPASPTLNDDRPDSTAPSSALLSSNTKSSEEAASDTIIGATPSVTYPTPRAKGSNYQADLQNFVPPDISGMSKSEARLVKNRAAAFLSRHRKRQAFASMAVRLEQLQDENAMLRGHLSETAGGLPAVVDIKDVRASIEQVRRQLYDTEARAAALREQIEHARRSQLPVPEMTVAPASTSVEYSAESALHPSGTTGRREPLSSEAIQDLLVLMAVSSVLDEKFGSIWTESVRMTLSSAALRCCGRPRGEIGHAAFELSIAPWPVQGRLQVMFQHVSHVPEAQLPAEHGHITGCPGVMLELPMSTSEFAGLGITWNRGEGRRMRVVASRSPVPGLLDVDIF